jgi:hypothetical protein
MRVHSSGLIVIMLCGMAHGEDAFYSVPVDRLTIVEGNLPKETVPDLSRLSCPPAMI